MNSVLADVCITFTGPNPYSTSVTKNLTLYLYGTADNNILAPPEKGNILHEFGHILGLGNEQLSPDMKHEQIERSRYVEMIDARGEFPLTRLQPLRNCICKDVDGRKPT